MVPDIKNLSVVVIKVWRKRKEGFNGAMTSVYFKEISSLPIASADQPCIGALGVLVIKQFPDHSLCQSKEMIGSTSVSLRLFEQ
jgi:hypothetical protein